MGLDKSKVAAMEDFLRRMGTVLGRKVSVTITSPAGAVPAFTVDASSSKPSITISGNAMDWSNPARAWLQTKGFFYHEMMHVVADPLNNRAGLPFDLAGAANILSDETGEPRVAAMLPGTRSYFAMNVYEHILKGAKDPRTYALVYGRRSFLPKRFVAAARKLMLTAYAEKAVSEVEDIIDAYHMAANERAEHEEFVGLAKRFTEVLGGTAGLGMSETVVEGKMSEGAREAAMPSDEDGGESEDDGEEEGDSKPEPTYDDRADDGKEPESGGKDAEGDDDEGGEEPDDGSYDDAASGSEDATDDGGDASTSGTAKPKSTKEVAAAMRAMAKDLLDEATEDEGRTAIMEAEELGLLAVSSEAETEKAARELATLLRRIQTMAKSGYESDHHAGKLNLRAARQSRGLSTDIFQQWQPDRRAATKLNVGIVIDRSGSMGRRVPGSVWDATVESRRIEVVNQVAAAVAMACEKASPLLNKTMIRYFADSDVAAKNPSQKFDSKQLSQQSDGGNHPGDSMKACLDWLKTETGVKLLLVLTDSGWDTGDSPCCPGCSARDDVHAMGKDERDATETRDRAAREGVKPVVLLIGKERSLFSKFEQPLPEVKVQFEKVAETVFKLAQDAMREQARKVLA